MGNESKCLWHNSVGACMEQGNIMVTLVIIIIIIITFLAGILDEEGMTYGTHEGISSREDTLYKYVPVYLGHLKCNNNDNSDLHTHSVQLTLRHIVPQVSIRRGRHLHPDVWTLEPADGQPRRP